MILGGSGFIGNKLVEILCDDGSSPISCDIKNSHYLQENAKYVQTDILELSEMARLFSKYGTESVIHLVGLPSIGYCEKNPQLSFKLNVQSVQNTLEAMRKTDVKKIVFASSAAIYGCSNNGLLKETELANPVTIYGHHKLIAEQLIKSYCDSYGISYAILRLFNVYGADPNMGNDVISIFIRKAINGEEILVKGRKKFRDFIHVDDVGQAFKMATSNNGSNLVLNIGSGKQVTLYELAEITEKFFPNANIKYENTPDDGTGSIADTELAKKYLKFKPRDPYERIIEHYELFSKN